MNDGLDHLNDGDGGMTGKAEKGRSDPALILMAASHLTRLYLGEESERGGIANPAASRADSPGRNVEMCGNLGKKIFPRYYLAGIIFCQSIEYKQDVFGKPEVRAP